MILSLKLSIRVICIIALLLGSGLSYAGGKELCYEASVELFENYHKQLQQPNSNTAQFFNLSYLAGEMKNISISQSEIGERLIKYISSIDELQSAVTLISANVSCLDRSVRMIFRVIDSGLINRGEFILVRLVDGKITNVSFESSGKLMDGQAIQDLGYKVLEK